MTPFMERFPEVGARETRSATVTQRQDLPDGEYGFLELYCDEPGCDCRRVTICVLRPETGWSKIWATISYGWESVDFYREWGGAHSDPIEMKGPCLDPLNAQTKYSSALLNLFRFLLQSTDYVERLKRHYQMFRDSVERRWPAGQPGNQSNRKQAEAPPRPEASPPASSLNCANGPVPHPDHRSTCRHETHWFYRFWPYTEGNAMFIVDTEHPEHNTYT